MNKLVDEVNKLADEVGMRFINHNRLVRTFNHDTTGGIQFLLCNGEMFSCSEMVNLNNGRSASKICIQISHNHNDFH